MGIAAPGQLKNPLFADQNSPNLSIPNRAVKKKNVLETSPPQETGLKGPSEAQENAGRGRGIGRMDRNSALTIISPTLYAESASQGWTPLDIVVGMPAGKTKTILCDLTGKLPADARRLRLSTTFEIRWDCVALFERATAPMTPRLRLGFGESPLPGAQLHELTPRLAQLRWRGFSEIR